MTDTAQPNSNKITRKLWCTECGELTSWEVDIDDYNELLLTCGGCSHILKFPEGTDAETLDSHIENHNQLHEGVIAKSKRLEKLGFVADKDANETKEPEMSASETSQTETQ